MAESAGIFRDARCVIVCGTSYNGKTADGRFRADLFTTTLAGFAAYGRQFPVVVADTSPDPAFVQAACQRYRAVYLDARGDRGIGPQNIAAIRYAYECGARFVLRIDPEKNGLTDAHVLATLMCALESAGAADIYSVGRSPDGAYESLPVFQQITEQIMSRSLASLGLPEDTASGIRAMNRRGMEVFMAFDYATHGRQWEFMWYALIDAMVTGLNVGELFLPFMHPVSMTAKETGALEESAEAAWAKEVEYNLKRIMQAALIIPKVVAYAVSRGIQPKWDAKRVWVISQTPTLISKRP